MSHEPECGYAANATWEGCMCEQLRAAYKRGYNKGREDARKAIETDLANNGDSYHPDHWHCCFRENVLVVALGGEEG